MSGLVRVARKTKLQAKILHITDLLRSTDQCEELALKREHLMQNNEAFILLPTDLALHFVFQKSLGMYY